MVFPIMAFPGHVTLRYHSGKEKQMSESVSIEIQTGRVFGTLLVPDREQPHPVVLFIAGSGTTNRDGNSEKMKRGNNSLRMLAEGLARGGIASLRYDKRGVGESRRAGGNLEETCFEDMVRDAEGWLSSLRADVRFDRIYLAGHSQGSLTAMLAARTGGVAGLVSLEGAGRPIDLLLAEQMKRQPGFIRKMSDRILASLRRGERVEKINFLLKSLYRPEIQPFLRSWMAYDPAQVLRTLKLPVLLVQGGRDIQTRETDFEALRSARPDATTLYLETMNHVLKECGPSLRANVATYTNPDLPLAPGLLGAVAEFINGGGSAEAASP